MLARAVLFVLALTISGTATAAMQTRTVSESTDGMRLVLEIRPSDPVRSELDVDGVPFTRFEYPGMAPEGDAGTPELCVGSELVALPPGGRASVSVIESEIGRAHV